MNENKRRGLLRFVARVLVLLFVQVLSLAIMAWLLSGLQVQGVWTAIVAVVVIALLNALLWPLLSYLILPFAVLTLGLASLALNGALILLASSLVDGFSVDSLGTGVLLALGLTAINGILGSLLNIDDDSAWYRNVLRRQIRRRKDVVPTDEPGFLFLEFDGLARPVLERAMDEGYAPTCRPRPQPARPASCTATMTTSPPFAGTTGPPGRSSPPAIPGSCPG